MADKIDVLRDKLFAQSDAKLRRLIDERLEPVRQLVGGRPGMKIKVNDGTYSLEQVVTKLADALHAERRDQARAETVSEFIKKVEEFGK